MSGWKVDILTIFPEMFPGPLGISIAGKALERGLWTFEATDIRDFADDKHNTVDDTPCGGGPGMVMRADVIDSALSSISEIGDRPVVYLTPRGKTFDQKMARDFADGPGIIFVCGRYEGIDERFLDMHKPHQVSLGDFVLSGGEPAAIAIIDCCIRHIPGILGDKESLSEESFERGLLEYPHYTRPQLWRGRSVPEVLLSGHHKKISNWRREQSERLTRNHRPDLWSAYTAQQ
ncbi:MAG: tRNA (guanosine(37)-N1)-methyltransferase TrmD [Rhodospirillaceae bacterium]|nr:tRNA (guanosine(37)-N1)-methyltransferase TrmD [Rhodospirillaceae bacterium]|tara:strand:- start:394 stop:1092 length:699 start_codon:yes stop_codon:yes gene_type:complete